MVSYPSASRQPQARRHWLPLILSGLIGSIAAACVTYLLWPTWIFQPATDPSHLPVSIGGTPFVVQPNAVRMKLQKRSGPQERVDLSFLYPSLEPPSATIHLDAEALNQHPRPVDRIFLSIAAHHDVLPPDERIQTIYPRYIDLNGSRTEDGLTLRPFRDGTPYSGEDLVFAPSPWLVARCSRDASTPGMCLTEIRIEGADLMFRFPRAWLAQWRDVAKAIEQLLARVHPR